MPNLPATLYIVATPIGNLGDLSQRAREILQSVDIIAAEDTRHSGKLLAACGIKPQRLLAYHEHNEAAQAAALLKLLQRGESVALVSDAGTPLISDPGYTLVRQARAQGIQVVPVPGPSALIAALSASGLATDRFVFEGFLPSKAMARAKRLQGFSAETRTMVFYETTHRILASLADMREVFGGDRQACLARELTKLHETILQAPLAELLDSLRRQPQQQKGEFVMIVAGAPALARDQAEHHILHAIEILLEEMPVKKAAALASRLLEIPRNRAYEIALELSARRLRGDRDAPTESEAE